MMNTNVSKLTEICFRILLFLFGILGNSSLLFFTIPSVPRRIEPYKILLINLAVSDLLTNCMVDLPSILVEIYGTWFLGNSYCKIFWFIASLSITNSILTTLAMSIFWFQKLLGSRPTKCMIYRSAELRLLSILIPLGWLVSVTFSAPFLFVCNVHVMKGEDEEPHKLKLNHSIFGCQDAFPSRSQKNLYEVLYLILANALPILGMLVINVRVIIYLIRNRKRVTSLKCQKSTVTSSVPSSTGDGNKCQLNRGQEGNVVVSTIPSTPKKIVTSEDPLKGDFKHVDRDPMSDQEQKHPPASPTTEVHELKTPHLVLAPEPNSISSDMNVYRPGEVYAIGVTCSQDQCILGNGNDNLPNILNSLDPKGHPPPKKAIRYISTTTQIRAALSIIAVVGVFLIFWVTHLTLRIIEDTNGPEHIVDTASLIAASYTTIIPYIFIYSMKKCPCG